METLRQLASTYRFAGVTPEDMGDHSLADAICTALETPDARLCEAAANALWSLAQRGADVQFGGTSDARRRLGFLADSLSRRTDAPALLREWAHELWNGPSSEPLVLTSEISASRLARLISDGSELSRSWNVWGQVSLRDEYL